jgi:hypothetical protein
MEKPYSLLVYVVALKDSSGAADGVTVSAGGVTVSADFDLQAVKVRPRTSNMTINTVTNLHVLFAMVPPLKYY